MLFNIKCWSAGSCFTGPKNLSLLLPRIERSWHNELIRKANKPAAAVLEYNYSEVRIRITLTPRSSSDPNEKSECKLDRNAPYSYFLTGMMSVEHGEERIAFLILSLCFVCAMQGIHYNLGSALVGIRQKFNLRGGFFCYCLRGHCFSQGSDNDLFGIEFGRSCIFNRMLRMNLTVCLWTSHNQMNLVQNGVSVASNDTLKCLCKLRK